MEPELDIWKRNRELLTGYFDTYSTAQLNTIPPGFSNNLIWNIGHIITVQKMLVYGLSGLKLSLPESMVPRFKKGTRPEGKVDGEETARLRHMLLEGVEELHRDLDSGIFVAFTPYENSFGFHIRTLQEAIAFNNYHEGLHMGYMMSIRKFL